MSPRTDLLLRIALIVAVLLIVSLYATSRVKSAPSKGGDYFDWRSGTLESSAVIGLPVATMSEPRGYGSLSVGAPTSEPAPTSGIGTALIGGWIGWAEPELGPNYLATRFPRGTLVRICAVECITRRTTDFGPSAAIDPPRIADLSVLDWEAISGLPRSRGLVLGSIETINEAPLPATDTDE